jgi:hypothetical protein
MCCSKSGFPKLLNARDMPLHLLGDSGDGRPLFVSHEHQSSPLNRALLMELDVEPFPMVPFPRGLDRENYIIVHLSSRKTD